MRARAAVAITLAGLVLSGCAYQATVPPVSGQALGEIGKRQPGKYAVSVQTGGWSLSANIKTMGCAVHSYSVDLNPTWEKAARDAMTSSFQKVDFITTLKTAEELKRDGYAGMIVLTQSNATSDIAVVPRFFVSEATAETSLDVLMVINWPDGTSNHQSFSGRGRSSRDVFGCAGPEDALGLSAGRAVRSVLREAVLTMKLLLAQNK
jgi:hypothetical protein